MPVIAIFSLETSTLSFGFDNCPAKPPRAFPQYVGSRLWVQGSSPPTRFAFLFRAFAVGSPRRRISLPICQTSIPFQHSIQGGRGGDSVSASQMLSYPATCSLKRYTPHTPCTKRTHFRIQISSSNAPAPDLPCLLSLILLTSLHGTQLSLSGIERKSQIGPYKSTSNQFLPSDCKIETFKGKDQISYIQFTDINPRETQRNSIILNFTLHVRERTQ